MGAGFRQGLFNMTSIAPFRTRDQLGGRLLEGNIFLVAKTSAICLCGRSAPR